ncbi:MAG: FKBP-type peptidyl-prolyl cis-trans isomerase [Bacteroidales bacterium]|nr:FKBP-type peptidyl-prolyl cis-trans isomerase [Bacteroidales bacterium]
MRRPIIILLTATAIALLFAACHQTPVIDTERTAEPSLKENLINANRYMAKSEEQQIVSYIERRGWTMQTLGSGVRLLETKRGTGGAIDYEDTVSVSYRLEAINGVVIYDQHSETFVAGRGQTVRGLDVAVRHLRHGSQATIILPSEQAYGVVGDGDRVPTRAILIYYLTVQ